MKILGYTLPTVKHPSCDVVIHPHQAAMLDAWNHYNSLMLVTKTGSGKTAATVLPVAFNLDKTGDNCAVFVYPTNELIRDQERSIRDWLEQRLHVKVKTITPENANSPSDDATVELVRIDAQLLEQYCEVWHLRTRRGKPDKGRALERLLHAPKAKIVLINPDILYLVYGLRYSRAQNVLAAWQAFQTIVFDEFHLYQGVELAHILYLIHAARKFGAFNRVVLLTATPHPDVRAWTQKLLAPHEITMETTSPHPVCGDRTVAHDVELSMLRSGRGKEVDVAFAKILELLPQIQALRAGHADDQKYVPCVVILNSVVKAIELEQRLLSHGLEVDQIVPIRGMSDRRIRKLGPNQLLVLGTSAIEVGIDFQCDYLIFEASDAASFMQRFGRLGRHAPGIAFLIGSERECRVIDALPPEISRTQLEETVANTYEAADAKAWFVDTPLGAFAALTQAFNIRDQVFRDRDDGVDAPKVKEQLFAALKEMMDEYAERLGIHKSVKAAQETFWFYARGKGLRWVEDYLKIDSFRCGLPNERVHDLSEERRRGTQAARYDVDIGTILEKSANPTNRNDVIYVDNFAEHHKVQTAQAASHFSDIEGTLQTTSEYQNVMLTRDGKLENVSSVMSRRGVGHVFVFVPKDEVQLDWRMKWFYTRDYKHVLAFDGDALLLKEMWLRQKMQRATRMQA